MASARVEARRTELLDAALRVIRRHGRNASMEEIAAEAGITKPILYRHFGDKGGLCNEIAAIKVSEMMKLIGDAFQSGLAGRELVAEVMDAFFTVVEDDSFVWQFLMAETEHPEGHAAAAGFAGQVAHQLAGRFRAGGVDETTADIWGHAVVGMVHSAGDWWLAHRDLTRRHVVETLADLAVGGLRRMGGRPLMRGVGGWSSPAAPGCPTACRRRGAGKLRTPRL